jgi:predicted nucleic acid-binding protein
MESARPTTKIRVFIDSSTLLAAAISSTGPARELVLRGIRGEADLVMSSLVLEETERNLAQKAPEALPVFSLLRSVLSAKRVNPTKASVIRVSRTVNLKDAPIVAAALRAKVDYLATHDVRTLLRFRDEIKQKLELEVVEPHEVLVILRGQGRAGGSSAGR